MSGVDETGEYDELDEQIIDALAADPRVQWSYKQRRSVRRLVQRLMARERLNSVQLYMDTCGENGIDPSWPTLHEYQDGQQAAFDELYAQLTPNQGDKQ